MINPILKLCRDGDYQATFLTQYWPPAALSLLEQFFAPHPNISVAGAPYPDRHGIISSELAPRLPPDVWNKVDLGYYQTLKRTVERDTLDLIQVEHSQMAWVVPLLRTIVPGTPLILSLHNVEHRLWERWWRVAGAKDAQLWQRFDKLRRWEEAVWPWFDACVTVAPEETEMFREVTMGQVPVVEVPTGGGIELDRFHGSTPDRASRNDIIFLGNLEWFPNSQGTQWFIEKVLPLIKLEVADARLLLAGYGKPRRELAAALRGRSDIHLIGEIDDEVELLSRAKAFVVPLWIAAGARVKILTAWAASVPVVATTIGAEGLRYTNGEDILIADEPAQFADQVVRVLTDRSLREHLRASGSALVERLYSLDTCTSVLNELYQTLVKEKAQDKWDQHFFREQETIVAEHAQVKERALSRLERSRRYRLWLRLGGRVPWRFLRLIPSG